MGYKSIKLTYFKDGEMQVITKGTLRKADPDEFTREAAVKYFPQISTQMLTHDAIVAEADGRAFIFLKDEK